MSLTCGFFNSEDGDREYFNQDLSNFLEGLITDGIYEFIDDHMMITASETPDMYINIGKGRAWFNATWTKIDATVRQEIPAADAVLNRIDAICLTVNKTRAVRDNYIEIISGTGAAGTPTKPEVVDETDIYRHVLAYVTVPKGATAITQAQIENRIGMGSALFSAPKWGNVPTTEEMVAQWQAQFDQFMDHIHETFDYDAAGNLQVGIDNLAPAYDSGETYVEGDFVLDANVLKKMVEGVFTPKLVSEEIKDMKSTFQDGVDAVYNAVVAEGVTPASSTPEDIAAAIATIRNGGNATAADIVAGKTALSGKRLLTGTRKQTETYTFPANDTGGTKDLGEQNLYRYVNATNVYNKGYATARTRMTAILNEVKNFPGGSTGGIWRSHPVAPVTGYYLVVCSGCSSSPACSGTRGAGYDGPTAGSVQLLDQLLSDTGYIAVWSGLFYMTAGSQIQVYSTGAACINQAFRLYP